MEVLGMMQWGIRSRLELLLHPTYVRARIYDRVRKQLIRLLGIRPRDDTDYYPVLRWLVSRRLVYAAIILAGIFGAFYLFLINPIINIEKIGNGNTVYTYHAIPLRFHNGNVCIRAKSGYIAYEGGVKGGYVQGEGSLYNENGNPVYRGSFAKSMFEGDGRLYYPEGQVQYEGGFSQNLYEGEGTLFWKNGVKRYAGAFSQGFMEGEGTLYNATGTVIFKGGYHRGEPVYAQILGKTTQELATMYAGRSILYQTDDAYAVVLEEIGVVYHCTAATQSIDDTLRADAVSVCRGEFVYGDKRLTSLEEIRAAMGEVSYEGNSYVTYLDAVSIDWINRGKNPTGVEVALETQQLFSEYRQVDFYSKDALVYLHVFEQDALTYTFVSKDKDGSFFLYEIE